ncbi:MAG: hypothetical protein PHH59_09630 [Methylovulum sp.]|uniref:hypothetical protein n=1 Tax=Methylovulum sp. TaxID=1916980 RepID=UPI002610C0BC|nr:hypothetical protein [Methylovulum sp.]MDD2724265.1 hypothetical protein [Methylovulum sp.]MDD5123002.1 hypothetical protein [Methylovulum sp.]
MLIFEVTASDADSRKMHSLFAGKRIYSNEQSICLSSFFIFSGHNFNKNEAILYFVANKML